MTTPAPVVSLDTSVGTVVKLMLEGHLEGIAVVDNNGKYAGMVTESALLSRHARVHLPAYLGIMGIVLPFGARHGDADVRRALATTVADLMSPDAHSITPDADIDDVATLMVEDGGGPFPVLEKGQVLGIVGRREFLRLILVEEGDEAEPA